MNKQVELEITDMLDDGRAFGRCESLAVFVNGSCSADDGRKFAGAVPGDRVRASINKERKSSADATLLEVIRASEERIEAICPYYADCGGCSMQELTYDAQLALKQRQFTSKIKRLGGLDDPKIMEIVGADTLQYYRNKATFAVGNQGEVGFYKGRSHVVIDTPDCMLQSDAAMVCADALRHFLKSPEGKGLAGTVVRNMTVRTAFGTGEVMAIIESDRRDVPEVDTLIMMLDDAVRSTSFYLESVALVYDRTSRASQSSKCVILAGKGTITDEFVSRGGSKLRYEISPQSFMQVNPEQMVRLYDKVADYACLRGGESIFDLYCGAGTIGIWLLEELRHRDEEALANTKVIGIENVKSAVIDANRNSVINQLVGTRYIYGRAEEELPLLPYSSPCVAILDPPRAGCDKALLEALIKASPEHIVYVSCDPGTIARDIKYLVANGYEFIEATPVDMFPWTSKLEVVAKLSRR